MKTVNTLSASLEDYVEAIFHIESDKRAARASDIARRLGVKSASVTGALRALAERELVNYTPYDLVTLTTRGRRAARDVIRRHDVLREFFVKVLGVRADEAEDAACKMEHAVSSDIVDRFTRFLAFVETCPRGGPEWLTGFGDHCGHDGVHEDCRRCIAVCLEEVRGKLTDPRPAG